MGTSQCRDLLPSKGQTGDYWCREQEQEVLGRVGGKLQPNTKTLTPNMGCDLPFPNEADLGCLRARRVQDKPSSIVGSSTNPHGSDMLSWGDLGAKPSCWSPDPQSSPLQVLGRGAGFPPNPPSGGQLPCRAGEAQDQCCPRKALAGSFPRMLHKKRKAFLPFPATAQQGQTAVWHGAYSS